MAKKRIVKIGKKVVQTPPEQPLAEKAKAVVKSLPKPTPTPEKPPKKAHASKSASDGGWTPPLAYIIAGGVVIVTIGGYWYAFRKTDEEVLETAQQQADPLFAAEEVKKIRALARLDAVNAAEQVLEARKHAEEFPKEPIDNLTDAATVTTTPAVESDPTKSQMEAADEAAKPAPLGGPPPAIVGVDINSLV